MREIKCETITKAVAEACIKANRELPDDLCNLISECGAKETCPLAKSIFADMEKNLDIARNEQMPICQDTGMAVIFAEVGQDVHIVGGSFEDAVNRGVSQGYVDGLLRCSVVKDPILRGNTGDNTPAVIHTRIVEGDRITLKIAPKGFGSENMSRLKMFTPAASEQDIIDFVVETVKIAGGNPCPPVVLGVGIGGDFEKCAMLAKQALCRPVSECNKNDYYKDLEKKMLDAVNTLDIGAQGFSGDITALAVNIEYYPTHIAGLPVSVNVGCHVTRHEEIFI